jgi:hypothetical protein
VASKGVEYMLQTTNQRSKQNRDVDASSSIAALGGIEANVVL